MRRFFKEIALELVSRAFFVFCRLQKDAGLRCEDLHRGPGIELQALPELAGDDDAPELIHVADYSYCFHTTLFSVLLISVRYSITDLQTRLSRFLPIFVESLFGLFLLGTA